ncbi:MAG: AraC family transcriptional regulator [Cyclobacteriaceae bacterium]
MSQDQFTLSNGDSIELEPFPHIMVFGQRKSAIVELHSFEITTAEQLCVFNILEGKFDWVIDGKHQLIYPGDTVLVLPGQQIGGAQGYLGVGSFFTLQLKLKKLTPENGLGLGRWSGMSSSERFSIGKLLLLNNSPTLKVKEITDFFKEMYSEIITQEIGYITRVNQLLDAMLILLGRQSTKQSTSRRDFPQTFLNLEQSLRKNLSHQWTVEEMAAMVGLGTTSFTEKVKGYTGFSPVHYLINLRVSEAIKLLKKDTYSITSIALKTGFYSSQHFSTTFKKLTGQTPGEFRQKNISNI